MRWEEVAQELEKGREEDTSCVLVCVAREELQCGEEAPCVFGLHLRSTKEGEDSSLRRRGG